MNDLFRQYRSLNQEGLNKELLKSCRLNEFEKFVYLLTSPELEKHAVCDVITGNELNAACYSACKKHDSRIIKHLLTLPEFQNSPNIQTHLDACLIKACEHNFLELVKFLLTSSELKDHANIHAKKDQPLSKACENGDVNVVKYLLTSSELKEHANVYADDCESFDNALLFDSMDVINYLIFDYNMEKKTGVVTSLSAFPNANSDTINSWFNLRDLHDKLKIELNSSSELKSDPKRIKI
jgi:hypothetical protein